MPRSDTPTMAATMHTTSRNPSRSLWRRRSTWGELTSFLSRFNRRDDRVGALRGKAALVAPQAVEPLRAGRLFLTFGDHAQRLDDARHDVGVAARVAAHGPEPVLHRAEVRAGLGEHRAEGA